LEYSISKQWIEDRTIFPASPVTPGYTITENYRETIPGDNIGLYFSLPLGFATAYANASWHTDEVSSYYEIKGEPLSADNYWGKEDYSTINARVGLLGSVGALNYDTYLSIERSGGTVTSDKEDFASMGDKLVTYDSYLDICLYFNLSYVALKNETARVLVGANNLVDVNFLDGIDSDEPLRTELYQWPIENGTRVALVISPNILGEVIIADNLLAFAGAMHRINFIFGGDIDEARERGHNKITIRQRPTFAFIGLRYQKNNWALETQVSDNVFNNPFDGFSGSDMFASFGGFIYF